jgi:hypothetical protein
LQRGWPLAYAQYRLWAQAAQELPTRDMLGLYANWQDAIVPHLDLSAMVRANRADNSRTHWVEARYHWSHTDVALQLQVNSGGPLSDFGASAAAAHLASVTAAVFLRRTAAGLGQLGCSSLTEQRFSRH